MTAGLASSSGTTAREDQTVGAFAPFPMPGLRAAWVPITCQEYDQLRVRGWLTLQLTELPARIQGDRVLAVHAVDGGPVLATVRVPVGGRLRCHHLHYDPRAVGR